MAKPESFFCHDPRSRSTDPERLTLGEGAETDGAGGADNESSFSGLSGTFFFEAVDPRAEGRAQQTAQYQ